MVTARLVRDGEILEGTSMEYAGTVSTFRGTLVPPSPGPVTLEVLAANPAEANFARFRRELEVTGR